ncbi:tail tape measure protein [Parasphingorhabdus sp.]|uniref:tail tape measure protein n=1 Tax=Parasphingorhabdus sp. TaxID=2709688 RepID=UPI003266DE36
MDDEIEQLTVRVRADTISFAKDVADMKAQLDGPFSDGLEKAGSALQGTLSRAIRQGSLDFEDLKRTALAVIAEIANAAISSGLARLLGSGESDGNGGFSGIGNAVLGAVLGMPGRATGGPVTQGRAYQVGEQGPELFVPASSGRIENLEPSTRQPSLQLTINISDNGRGSAPDQMRRSSRQVARVVRNALASRSL